MALREVWDVCLQKINMISQTYALCLVLFVVVVYIIGSRWIHTSGVSLQPILLLSFTLKCFNNGANIKAICTFEYTIARIRDFARSYDRTSHIETHLRCLIDFPHFIFLYCASFDIHDDVIKWKHFPRYWPFVRGIHRSPVNSPQKGQRHGALMFSLICAWINSWVNDRMAGDLRRHHAHYDVTLMGNGDRFRRLQRKGTSALYV